VAPFLVVPGGYGERLGQSVDEVGGVLGVVLTTELIDEEMEQRQSRLVGSSVDQFSQRRHPEPERVTSVATLHSAQQPVTKNHVRDYDNL